MRTSWSSERNILWVTMPDENLISSIFKRQAEIGRERIKLLKYIPPWSYERNKELEIQCRLEREKNPDLRTKILLGHRDLKLNIKLKGDNFYKRVNVEYFGRLPGFNFTRVADLSPGSPTGRRRFSSDDEPLVTKKRSTRSESKSPPQQPETSKLRVEDISFDE